MGDLSKPKGTASDGSFQGSPPLLSFASRKRTISVSWTPPGLGRPGVVEAPGFLCWSLRFASCGRVVPAWGLLSLGFSPTATRGMGEEESRNQKSKTRTKWKRALLTLIPRSGRKRRAFQVVEMRAVRTCLQLYLVLVSVSLSLTKSDSTFPDNISRLVLSLTRERHFGKQTSRTSTNI